MMKSGLCCFLILILAYPMLSAETAAQSDQQADDGVSTKIEKLSTQYLPNAVRLTGTVISGGLPEGEKAFAELEAMGIRTVISVDGAKPDVALAEKHGLRYVHLPHGYDGVPADRARELAKAVRDLPGPIYIHCHHGKHRSPAAAAVACVGAGLIRQEAGATVLKVAGTSEAYQGLFQSVDRARPISAATLDELKADFPSTAKLPKMAEAMVDIEHLHDHLKAIEKSGWKAPVDQPALVPRHEALLLREQFTEMLRTKDLESRPATFRKLTIESEDCCRQLEDALADPGTTAEKASRLLLAINDRCKACHQLHRDRPHNHP